MAPSRFQVFLIVSVVALQIIALEAQTCALLQDGYSNYLLSRFPGNKLDPALVYRTLGVTSDDGWCQGNCTCDCACKAWVQEKLLTVAPTVKTCYLLTSAIVNASVIVDATRNVQYGNRGTRLETTSFPNAACATAILPSPPSSSGASPPPPSPPPAVASPPPSPPPAVASPPPSPPPAVASPPPSPPPAVASPPPSPPPAAASSPPPSPPPAAASSPPPSPPPAPASSLPASPPPPTPAAATGGTCAIPPASPCGTKKAKWSAVRKCSVKKGVATVTITLTSSIASPVALSVKPPSGTQFVNGVPKSTCKPSSKGKCSLCYQAANQRQVLIASNAKSVVYTFTTKACPSKITATLYPCK